MINSYYNLKEAEGRKIAYQILGHKQELVFIEAPMSRIDASGTSVTATTIVPTTPRNFYIEIKTRDYNSYDFDTDFLEEDKVNGMMQQANDPTGIFIYLMIFKDGVARLYYLNRIPTSKVTKKVETLVRTSGADNGKVDKVTYHLPVELAKVYKWK